MKKFFKTLTIISISNTVVYSQTLPLPSNNNFNNPPVSILSPSAASLGSFGTYNVNYYTGTPNITVPLYEITDPGIKIPISLSYDASGFIPNKNSSQVGMNWNIIAGGVITRTVRGVPDEKRDVNYASSSLDDQCTKNHTGYIWGIQHNSPSTYPTQSYVENLSFLSTNVNNITGYPQVIGMNVLYEYNPDLFSFNFLGHSGTFVMGNDGIVKVNSDRRYKVDLSGLTEQYNIGEKIRTEALSGSINTNQNFSKIIITSDDGYIFHFGGLFSSLEISFKYPTIYHRSIDGKSGVISSWHLTKIITPDGDSVIFDYGTYNNDAIEVLKRIDIEANGSWDNKEVDFMDIRLYIGDTKQVWNLYNSTGSNSGLSENKSLIKLANLKSILTKTKKVTFFYTPKNETSENKFYSGDQYENVINKNYKYFSSKLDQISIKDRLNIIRHTENDEQFDIEPIIYYNFNYQYFGSQSTGYRLFLSNINSDKDHYAFSYSKITELPHPLTAGVDKWGFYNGQDANYGLVAFSNSIYGDPAEFETNFTIAGHIRTANPSKADVGLLQKITFPTGGITEFEFEAHKYKKVLKRKINSISGNSIIPEWSSLNIGEDDVAGGCRIKKITTKTSSSEISVVKNFKYIKDYNINPNGPSSGLLTDYGVFRIRYNNDNGDYHDQLFDQNIAKASGISEPHICYSEVVEINGLGSEGFTKYIFTNPDNQDYTPPVACPDNYFLSPGAIRIFATINHVVSLENQMKRLARYSSRATERGKLSKNEIYNSTGNLIKSVEYEYNNDINRFNEKTVGYEKIYNQQYPDATFYYGFSYFFNSFHIYNYHNNPTKITEKTFANGQTVTQTTNFVYKSNANHLLTEKSISKSDGSVFRIFYYYPEDKISDPEYPSSQGMVNKHMLATVIEEKIYKGTTLLHTQKNIYTDINGYGIYKLQNTKTINHTINPATLNQWMNINYYTDGMVKESYNQNDFKTAYIWDYKKTLPIAEVKNVNSASDIAYTSFETEENWASGGYSQWNYDLSSCIHSFLSPTGVKTYHLNNIAANTISRNLNPSINYKLSLWFKGSSINVGGLIPVFEKVIGAWTYKEYLLSGTSNIEISGSGNLDELRLYPKDALMTTYTYQPLFGITSQCDHKYTISYFSHDNSGRLRLVRNYERNIIKKICYNYAGQSENCIDCTGESNTPNWQNTSTPPTCEQNICGNTGYILQEQKDMNPCSPSYNQLRNISVYNPSACVPSSNIIITYSNNTNNAGFTAKYTNAVTGQVYTFTIPQSGTGQLGCIPAGTYSLKVSKTGNIMLMLFGTGCFNQSGVSAFWNKLIVPGTGCTQVTIDYDL